MNSHAVYAYGVVSSSTLYRVRKFTRRHRAATAASMLAAIAIVGGLVSTTIFAAAVAASVSP